MMCTLCLLLPTDRVSDVAIQHLLPDEGWSSLEGCVDSVNSATAAPDEPRPPASLQQEEGRVIWRGGDLLPWGLFPANRRDATVRVRCVYNKPTFWGQRQLLAGELAALWDVPILWRDWAVKWGLDAVLRAFTDSVPGKCLVLGGDYLLTSCVRGGWEAQAGEPAKRRRLEPPTAVQEERCESLSAAAGEAALTTMVVKKLKDKQKGDDEEVPVHLWDKMYLLSRRI